MEQFGAERLVNDQLGLKMSESSRVTRNGVVEDGVDVCPVALKQWHRRGLRQALRLRKLTLGAGGVARVAVRVGR